MHLFCHQLNSCTSTNWCHGRNKGICQHICLLASFTPVPRCSSHSCRPCLSGLKALGVTTELLAGSLEEELEKTRRDTGGSAHHALPESQESPPAGDLDVKGLLVWSSPDIRLSPWFMKCVLHWQSLDHWILEWLHLPGSSRGCCSVADLWMCTGPVGICLTWALVFLPECHKGFGWAQEYGEGENKSLLWVWRRCCLAVSFDRPLYHLLCHCVSVSPSSCPGAQNMLWMCIL